MEPALFEGDVVAWTPIKIEDIRVGDVIVFRSYVSWPDEKIVVHRVKNITTNSKGQLLLETKGDKNKFTDQAGPHIPEPYIREDHVLGKVISIGQQPLKIPFIGLFGIWINEGLDLISQPTASKESVNYIGVFAPLTISAVVLVVLIFVIPEKAKTIKEKLRLYIFGRRPLNLKKTAATFLIAYIVFFSVIHVFAYDEQTASVGINANCPDSAMQFGRLTPGATSFPVSLPIINPSIMPVKGIIFGKGEISDYISKKTFVLEKGKTEAFELRANAPENSKNGSYIGSVMVYSSPFWLMFPDNLIESLYNINAEATIYILDILSALILTTMTLFILLAITFIEDKIVIFTIDYSWCHPASLILSQQATKRFSNIKKSIKIYVKNNLAWILNIILLQKEEKIRSEIKKPLIASVVLLPIIFLLPDQVSAMIISVIFSGIIAYFISCKVRKKIVLATLIAAVISVSYMIIKSNLVIFGKEIETLEMITLSMGAIGIYLLVFTMLLIPLSAISWRIACYFRNVKERKDPLLALEGSCDL